MKNMIDKVVEALVKTFDKAESKPEAKFQSPAVFTVPDDIRDLMPSAFGPRVISIGPLHRKEERLQVMQDHKKDFMDRFEGHTIKSIQGNKFSQFLENLKTSGKATMNELIANIYAGKFYDMPKISIDDYTDFLKMHLLDSFFMLEFMFEYAYQPDEHMYKNFPILSNPFVLHTLIVDLLLLENQIPIQVLALFFPLTFTNVHDGLSSIDQLLISFLNKINVFQGRLTTNSVGAVEESRHLLEFLHKCLLPADMQPKDVERYSISEPYSVGEAYLAGVRFKPADDPENGFKLQVKITSNISVIPWRSSCSLSIPKLNFTDGTEKILSNLVAYEQCSPSRIPAVSSYIVFMAALVQSSQDVDRLKKAGILILNKVPSKEVLETFKSLNRIVILGSFCYIKEWKELDKYCKSSWPWLLIFQNRALTSLFGTTTWKTLGVIGALILFVLTLLQTIFTIKK